MDLEHLKILQFHTVRVESETHVRGKNYCGKGRFGLAQVLKTNKRKEFQINPLKAKWVTD